MNVHHINPQVAYDDVSGRFFIAGGGQLFVYDVKANRIDSIAYKGHPYIGASSQIIFDAKRNRLLSYTHYIDFYISESRTHFPYGLR